MRTVGRGWLVAGCAAVAVTVATASRVAGADGGSKAAPVHATRTGAVSYAKDVAPILAQNCASCHRPGEVAPFSLLSYDDAKKRAAQIAAVVESRVMPPWKAESHGEFVNERRLTAQQIDTLKAWATSGAPKGREADMPPAAAADANGIGKPDVWIEPAKSYTVRSEGRDIYRCFVIPTGYSEDRWVSAIDVRPGNRAVVHHVLVFLDTSGAARKMDGQDGQPGYSTFGGVGFIPSGGLGGWAPGNLPHPLPPGVGHLLPKGADIVLQVHYHPTGKTEVDHTKIGVYFCKGPVDKRMRSSMVINPFLAIPAGEKNHVVNAQLPVPADVTVLEVTPHMHLLGRSMNVVATLPDKSQKQLVKVPDWDFNWQTTYTFKEPLKLPKGTTLSLHASYDNSTSNPRNPNSPPKLVTWGEQTTNEMCIAFVGYTVDSEHLTKGVAANGMREFGRRGGGQGRALLNALLGGTPKP